MGLMGLIGLIGLIGPVIPVVSVAGFGRLAAMFRHWKKYFEKFLDSYRAKHATWWCMANLQEESAKELFENWTVQMRKGVLDLCILKALSAAEWYGYALVKALVAVPGVGVAEGSIYPLLARLRRQGLVTTRLEESREGPARKYYAATAEGRALAREMELYFAEMQRGFEGLQGRVDFTGPTAGWRGSGGVVGKGKGHV